MFKMIENFKLIFKTLFESKISLKLIVILSLIYSLAGIGCFYQIITISTLYFKYPTIVTIEAEHKQFEEELPAFSFCTYINRNLTQLSEMKNTTQDWYQRYNLSKTLFDVTLLNSNYEPINGSINPKEVRDGIIQTINSIYVCYTFNSLIKSKYKIIYQD